MDLNRNLVEPKQMPMKFGCNLADLSWTLSTFLAALKTDEGVLPITPSRRCFQFMVDKATMTAK